MKSIMKHKNPNSQIEISCLVSTPHLISSNLVHSQVLTPKQESSFSTNILRNIIKILNFSKDN